MQPSAVVAACLLCVASCACLPGAIPEDLRKNLTKDGESYPVGVVVPTWPSGQVTSATLEILMSEILGYNIRIDPRSAPSSMDGVYAVLGCTTWFDHEERGCENRRVRIHFMAESWHPGFPAYKSIQILYPREVQEADMGYSGTSGQHIPHNILQAAETAAGLALDFYKSYNAKYFITPWDYFDKLADVNSSNFLPCEKVALLVDNATIFGYLQTSGDVGGVTFSNNDNSYKAFCSDGFFWRAPACRHLPQQCILYLSTGNGWDAMSALAKSTAFNMPVAYGVASSYANYLSMPMAFKSLFYWWTPDTSFLHLSPSRVIYPQHSRDEWIRQQVYTSTHEDYSLSKIFSHELKLLAPDIVKLLEGSFFDLDIVNKMLEDMQFNAASPSEAACRWLQNKTYEARWKDWIPIETDCGPGFGLYNEETQSFVNKRQEANTCRACLPGTYSVQIIDGGPTSICAACPIGEQQVAAGATKCEPCLRGTHKAFPSNDICTPCSAGFYADEEGAAHCKSCQPSTTTLLLGARQSSDCVCMEGTIDVATSGMSRQCVVCGEGLLCPAGSTLESLRNHEAKTEVSKGYFSFQEDPLSIYKCPTAFCLGGSPGTCQGDRLGPTCAECPAGSYWADDTCAACEVSLQAAWISGAGAIFVLMIAGCYLIDSGYTARASLRECAGISADMMLSFVQQLGILSTVPVPWPQGLQDLFEFSSVFVLNLQNMGFDCASHGDVQRYILCTAVFVGVTISLPCMWCLTQIYPLRRRNWSWDVYKTLCVMGKFLQSGFTTMCNIGMVPFMCFLHPNGLSSIWKYSNTFCNTDGHRLMQVGGVVVLLLGMTHFIVCTWACCNAPSWSLTSQHRLVSIAFLMANFRPSAWWFGLVTLIRGTLLSVPAVIATNSPPVNLILMICVLIVCSSLQLYFLPWKAPVLNLIDATSTILFVILLAVSLHLEPTRADLLPFFDTLGIGLYYLSIGVIACVFTASMALLSWERCCKARTRRELRIVNLGTLPDADELLSALQVISQIYGQQGEKHRALLLKKVSVAMSAYDLFILQQAIDILFDDFELRPIGSTTSSLRIAAKRTSQMTRRSLAVLQPVKNADDETKEEENTQHEEEESEQHEEKHEEDSEKDEDEEVECAVISIEA